MKLRKELWFGFTLMALIIAAALGMLVSVEKITNGHVGLLMLSLVVVAIMLGFPTAFTLMGMRMLFTWLAYDRDWHRTLDLMVQSAFKVMGNDVLIAVPLFVFMGYLVERANLIQKLFHSLHLSMARVPGSLAVATLVTCAVFATATGIVGAVVTLMGLLALPAMLRAGYSVPLSAGAITAGGCLGILIPPSVLLIVYGATAGVSVVQLYAGAFFPGLMLAGLYVLYVIIVAKLKPAWAPPLSASDRLVALPAPLVSLGARNEQGAMGFMLRTLRRGDSAAEKTICASNWSSRWCPPCCLPRWRSGVTSFSRRKSAWMKCPPGLSAWALAAKRPAARVVWPSHPAAANPLRHPAAAWRSHRPSRRPLRKVDWPSRPTAATPRPPRATPAVWPNRQAPPPQRRRPPPLAAWPSLLRLARSPAAPARRRHRRPAPPRPPAPHAATGSPSAWARSRCWRTTHCSTSTGWKSSRCCCPASSRW